MGQLDRAGTAGDSLDDFYAARALALAESDANINEDLEAADEELFEDDLISLIVRRPSRYTRHSVR